MQFKVGDLVEDTFLEEVGIVINAWLGTVGEERVELLTPTPSNGTTKGIWKVQWVDGTHSVHHHCWLVVIRETV